MQNSIIVKAKMQKNGCYNIFTVNGKELHKNCINKSEVYAICDQFNYKLYKIN